MASLAGGKIKAKKPLPTGQVLGVLGLKYRTLYNYLRDFGEYFSEGARSPKKGKRWSPEDMTVIQTIRHLHSERRSQEEIKKALAEGYKTPLAGGYSPEDVNRLIESSWLLVNQANALLVETQKIFDRCKFCEWDLRYHIDKGFYKTIFEYEEFAHRLNQVELIVGRISDSHHARQMRDDEYQRLHQMIRYRILAEEEGRKEKQRELQGVEVEIAKNKLMLVHDQKAITKWVYDLLPRRRDHPKESQDGDKIIEP